MYFYAICIQCIFISSNAESFGSLTLRTNLSQKYLNVYIFYFIYIYFFFLLSIYFFSFYVYMYFLYKDPLNSLNTIVLIHREKILSQKLHRCYLIELEIFSSYFTKRKSLIENCKKYHWIQKKVLLLEIFMKSKIATGS